jgi:pyridoxamine 5'-phosphate oxidase family protein
MRTVSSKREAEGAVAHFSEREAEYLADNFLGRLATASASSQPHVVPVAYRFDGSGITFGGWRLQESLKYRNIMANNRVALVVDEVVSTRPWVVKGIEVRGVARPLRGHGGELMVRIRPRSIRSWGLEA